MNFRPPEELAEQLKAQADAERVSVQALLVKAAELYLSRNTKKAMISREVELVNRNFGESLRRLGEGA